MLQVGCCVMRGMGALHVGPARRMLSLLFVILLVCCSCRSWTSTSPLTEGMGGAAMALSSMLSLLFLSVLVCFCVRGAGSCCHHRRRCPLSSLPKERMRCFCHHCRHLLPANVSGWLLCNGRGRCIVRPLQERRTLSLLLAVVVIYCRRCRLSSSCVLIVISCC